MVIVYTLKSWKNTLLVNVSVYEQDLALVMLGIVSYLPMKLKVVLNFPQTILT